MHLYASIVEVPDIWGSWEGGGIIIHEGLEKCIKGKLDDVFFSIKPTPPRKRVSLNIPTSIALVIVAPKKPKSSIS
jgi:hypothetical protein